ncbi:hypothetical protein AB205_0075990 [Aquarana catesbeiana]|uniref:Uncharacterized protein n=1 Tax=Aquarana catesbeiana TaxID=8400 RepID=A0A2G9S790_AQUCT|nr:hypothetical protein AB205_0075990 [Aquarana catesbeiana]
MIIKCGTEVRYTLINHNIMTTHYDSSSRGKLASDISCKVHECYVMCMCKTFKYLLPLTEIPVLLSDNGFICFCLLKNEDIFVWESSRVGIYFLN